MIAFFGSNPYESTRQDAFLFAGGLVFAQFVTVLVYHPLMLYAFETAMKLRVACCSLIYDKVRYAKSIKKTIATKKSE